MPTHLALLRGVNVGGGNRVAMADLRRVVADLGHTDVATYIASGNVVFTSAANDPAEVADELAGAIAEHLDVTPDVVVVTRDEMAAVVAANPFPDVDDPRHLHAIFVARELDDDDLAAVGSAQRGAADAGGVDEVRVVGRTMYLHTPDGLGRSKLAAQLTRGVGTVSGTARNWRTVVRLLALLDG